MKKLDRACLARIIMGGILGLVASVALVPYLTNARSPSLAACLLCTALGATLGAATLPFADDGPTLVRRSLLHLGVTALEVALVLWLCVDLRDGRAWALWMGMLVLFYAGSMGHADFRLDMASVGFYPVVLFGTAFLGAALSYAPSLSLRFLFYHVSAALCVLVTVSAVRRTEDLKRLAAGGAVCVLVSSLYGVYQRIQGVEVNRSYVDLKVNAGMPGRVESFFDNANTFCEVLLLLLPLVIALVLCSRRLYSRLIAGGILVVGAAAAGMTYSRASWVGLACAMAVFVFLWRPRLIPLFAVLCVLCIPLLPDTIWNRILTIGNLSDSSTLNRIPTLLAALEMIRSRPLRGIGLGAVVPKTYAADWNLYHASFPYVHSHNFYLEVWLQTGLLGVVSFVGALLWNIKQAARTVRHCEPSAARTITCAAASALCGAMVCGLADYLWHYPRVMVIFWFVFAMALAGVKVCRREAAEMAGEA